jgi:hypothetical protein
MTKVYSYEDILAKADWEGGLYDGLDWFSAEEVPEEMREAWGKAKEKKHALEHALEALDKFFPED